MKTAAVLYKNNSPGSNYSLLAILVVLFVKSRIPWVLISSAFIYQKRQPGVISLMSFASEFQFDKKLILFPCKLQ